MIEYAAVFPDYDDKFIAGLHELGTLIFGDIDKQDYFSFHMNEMPDASVQVARNDSLVGFKIGYALNPKRYYSSLGGVHPECRREGVALRLMHDQHEWARARGYRTIETGVVNTNEAMLSLNIRVGFRIIGTYCRTDQPRVMLLKDL